MASYSVIKSTTSSGGSYPLQNSCSDEELQRLEDQRKMKRMVSNRESAKRSRMKKQKHLNDLMTQVSQLTNEKNQVLANVSITMHNYRNVEAENLVLRAQVMELSHRLESLNLIRWYMNQPVADSSCWFVDEPYSSDGTELIAEFVSNSLSCVYGNKPILASSNVI